MKYSLRRPTSLFLVVAGVGIVALVACYLISARTETNSLRSDAVVAGDGEWIAQIVFLKARFKDIKARDELTGSIPWFEDRLRSGTENEREDAALILGQIAKPGSRAESHLIESLDSETPRVMRAAIFSLGEMRSSASLPKLRELHKDKDQQLANEAQGAIRKLQ